MLLGKWNERELSWKLFVFYCSRSESLYSIVLNVQHFTKKLHDHCNPGSENCISVVFGEGQKKEEWLRVWVSFGVNPSPTFKQDFGLYKNKWVHYYHKSWKLGSVTAGNSFSPRSWTYILPPYWAKHHEVKKSVAFYCFLLNCVCVCAHAHTQNIYKIYSVPDFPLTSFILM